jgi:CBS domain-containing protein
MANLHVRDLMTSTVVSVGPGESISNVQALMNRKRIRHVPVVNRNGRVLGVVSERDVLRRALFEDTGKVTDIMAWKTETIEADETISRAARIMLDHKFGCLPVVENGLLTGILTEADFVKYLTKANRPTRR